jgi:serine/threonine-protein kinase
MTSSPRKYPELVPTIVRESERTPPPRIEEQQDNSYLAGDVIADRYRLVKKIGQGGMGVVWVAHSLVLGVDVALKLIRAGTSSPGVASRMAREAHAAARLGHPALVRVFDFGWTTRGDPFLVMELVLGEALSALLRREVRVGAVRAVQILLPIADGLRCAHEKGIVHRDIKPENVFLATDNFGRMQPKLLDFGIAKLDLPAIEARITQMGAVLGSPEFMSPEQARGQQDIDARSDIWSMSVMLYEMISGTLPFQDRNYNALMQAILNDEPVPTTEFAAGDAGLWKLVARGLAKKREERWSSMTEFGEALALWLYEHGVKEDACGNSVRALWLDAALSGVRVEVPTGQRNLEPSSGWPEAASNAPPEGPGLRSAVRVWARRASRYVEKRGVSLRLAAVGVALGAVVTWVATSSDGPAPASADAPRPVAPNERDRANTADGTKTARAAPASATAPSTAFEPSRPLSAEALPLSPATSSAAPRASSTAKKASAPSGARKKKSIHDFGF